MSQIHLRVCDTCLAVLAETGEPTGLPASGWYEVVGYYHGLRRDFCGLRCVREGVDGRLADPVWLRQPAFLDRLRGQIGGQIRRPPSEGHPPEVG